jgi:CBS domain-containing protein
MQIKGNQIVWSISPEDTVFEALRRMADKDVGALIVTEGERMVGIISERDYARKVILRGKTSRDTLVKEIMTEHVFTIHPDQTVDEVMDLMTNKKIRHVPVVEDAESQQVIGIISIGDVLKNIIYRQRETIKQYEPVRPYPSFKDE